MSDSTFDNYFRLKLLCDSLLQKPPNIEIIEEISDCIGHLPPPVLQNLMEYILFPTISHLGNSTVSHDMKFHLFSITNVITKTTRIIHMNLFKSLYTVLIRSLHKENQPTELIEGHEELKLLIITCLKNLFSRASIEVIESLYTRENSLKLSQSFFLCISISKNEKYSELRVAAIEALMTISWVHEEADENDKVLRNQIADVVMLYLPGIIRGMLDVCQGHEIQNHKVTLMAVRSLGRILALIMEDNEDEDPETFIMNLNTTKNSLKLELQNGGKEINEYLKTALRNREWLDAVSKKLNIPIRELKNLTKHSHWRVREELLKIVNLLLLKCTRNLDANFPELVDVIIILSEDDADDVREQAINYLDKIRNRIIKNSRMRSIIGLLEERLYELLIKFPRIIRSSDDATQLIHLNQLQGYLKILGKDRLPKIMNSVMHLRRLLLAFVYILELDSQEISVLDDDASILQTQSQMTMENWKKFKFINDSKVQKKVMIICKMIGEFGDFDVFVDSIFELTLNIPNYQKEFILLLNWVSMGARGSPGLYEQIINNYVSEELWSLPLIMENENSLSEIQSNILQNCLLIEGLGIFAEVLKNHYQQFLLTTLYLIIEKAGSKNRLLSVLALQTLEKCANSLGHENIESLLCENMDYISYHITIKVHRLERNIGVLDVVKIVMKYCSLNVLPYLVDIVKQALRQLQLVHQRNNFVSILQVLYTFVICIKEDSKPNFNTNTIKNSEYVINSLKEYCDAKRIEDMTDDFSCGIEESSVYEEENEGKPPLYIILVEDVVRSSINFVPSKNIQETLLSMKIIKTGIKILASWTNQLLPLIHELWFPLVNRFKQENLLIMKEAWQLLYKVAEVAEDFIRTQTFDEIIPPISKFLDTSASQSYKKNCENVYKFTQMFKLQENILSQFGLLAKYSKFNEKQIWKVLCVTENYLNHYQHCFLQKCCVELFKTISSLNSDVVWVKCLSIQNKKSKNGNKCEEYLNCYEENVKVILDYIEETTNCKKNLSLI